MSTASGRRGTLRCASPASQRGSAPLGCERGGELGRAAEIDVHGPHRERDGEHRGRVATGPSEAHRDEVGERHAGVRAARGDADRRDRQADVEDGHEPEGERNRPRQVELGTAELPGELRDRPPSRRRARRGCSPRCRRPTSRAARTATSCRRPSTGSATVIATAITTISTDDERELEAGGDAQAEDVRDEHGDEHREADGACDERARAGQVGHVVAADQRDGRGAEQDGAEEPAAGDGGRGFAEALAHVGGDAAGHGVPHAERGEGDGERRREHEQQAPRRRSTRRPPPAPRAPARAAAQGRSGRPHTAQRRG